MIKFKRPIVFLDFETTGTNTQHDRIVELCMIKYYPQPNGSMLAESPLKALYNPGIPIHKSASDIHGITDEMVKDCAPFKERAGEIHSFIKGCDLAGFNSNTFDIPILHAELARAAIVWDYSGILFFDACTIFKQKERRDLAAAVRFYLNHEHVGAHGAEADVEATAELFFKQTRIYEWPEDFTPEKLALYSNYDRPRLDLAGKFSYNAEGRTVFTFGANKDQVAQDFRPYLHWMIDKGDFPADTKAVAKKLAFTFQPL